MKLAKTPSAWECEGLISEVGDSVGAAREMIDSRGLALAPGIIDTHARYDAQICRDRTLDPSSRLAVRIKTVAVFLY